MSQYKKISNEVESQLFEELAAEPFIFRYMLKSVNTLIQKTDNVTCWAMMMMDFLRCKKKKTQEKTFVTCLGVTKLIINEQDVALVKKLNIPRRNCMKTKEELEEAIRNTITEYKEIIFGEDTPTCMAALDELRRQKVIDEKVFDQKLMDDTVRKPAWEGFQNI